MKNDELEARLSDAPIGFAVFEGSDMVMRRANSRYLTMVARDSSAVGKAWVDIFPELVGTPTHDAVLQALDGQRIEVKEFAVPLMDRGVVREGYYSFVLEPTRAESGAPGGIVVIAVEVTELVVRRREAEVLAAKLHVSEAHYRALFSSMDDGFCVIEILLDASGEPVDYRFIEVNEAFTRHTGLVEPVGKTARELVPDLDESWFRIYGNVAATGEGVRFENNAPAMGRWFDGFATRIGDAELRRVGVLFKDVSARKRADLEKEASLAAEKAARREAEEANRLKDEFLATVSHELRTPLNAMIGWLTLLRSGRVSPEKTAHALTTIERNARSQAQLVEDLLDVSRILEGKLRLDVDPLDLQTAVEAAIETVGPAATAKDIRIQATLASGTTVMGDAHRLQQIAWNLLANAVKFTPKGGRVQVVLERRDSSVELSVTDTGIGIGADFLPHVFERFRQADGGTTRAKGGLGLGLSIVRHLTEMHGGTVTAFSEGAGRGASFVVRLPLALTRRTPVYETPATSGFESPPELDGLEILAVDDEMDSRSMLQNLLESCGARVRTAGSVVEALQLFTERAPELLLSDIGMPGQDGFELIREVRALPSDRGGDVPAVALTAYARSADRTRCLLAGFNGHAPKPVEPLELVAVVASLSGRKRHSGRMD